MLTKLIITRALRWGPKLLASMSPSAVASVGSQNKELPRVLLLQRDCQIEYFILPEYFASRDPYPSRVPRYPYVYVNLIPLNT